MDRLVKFCLPKDLQVWLDQYKAPTYESAFAKDIPNSWHNHLMAVDWQRSLRSGRSIVASLDMDTLDHRPSAISTERIDSPYMKDNLPWHYMLCRP